MTQKKFKRILLKLSGEALMGDSGYGLHQPTVERIANEIATIAKAGHQVCVVVGGGNIFRGMAGVAQGMDRATADYMGMLATVMNALAMRGALENIGCPSRVLSAIPMEVVCGTYARERALHHLSEGRVVIFAAGTGNPFFTTDTTAALRAAEMGCEAIFKGTQVDGVYTADPKKDPAATRYEHLSHQEALAKDLKVMDAAAIALARDNKIPIIVFSIQEPGAFGQVLSGQGRFTVVS